MPDELGIESTLLRPGAEPLNLTPHITLEKFTTNANGGFGSAQFTLPGGPDKWAGQIPYLATLRLTHGSRLLYEGRVEDPGLKIAAGEMSTTVQCFGRHRLFADNSVRRIWSKREIPWRPITAAEGTVSVFAAALSLGKAAWNSITIGTFDQSDLRRRGVEVKGDAGGGAAAGAAHGVFYYAGGLALQRIIFDVTTDTADDAWYIVRSSTNGISWTERDAGQATSKTSVDVSLGGDTYVQLLAAEDGGSGGLNAFVQYEDIRLLGTSLNEDTDGGFWGGTLLRDLVGLIPGLSVGTIDTGDDFVVQQLDAAVRREGKAVLDEIAGYYTREPATWEDGRFDWRQPNLDEVHWTATIADLTSLELTGSIDGIGRTFYLLFANAALGIDDEAVAVSTDQRNPFVKTGQTKDVISSPGFPMTQNSAGQLAGKLANDTGRWPLVRGQLTLPLLRPVRHAAIGQAPAYCIRAGENILVADLPKTDWLAAGRDGETLFHVVSADVDLKANAVSLELEGQSKRADVLLARLSAVTKTLAG